jgi:hypothetical protein
LRLERELLSSVFSLSWEKTKVPLTLKRIQLES